jgi:glycosyltransferase involved in cell wall biosynthesis
MHILLCHNYYQYPGGEDAVFEAEQALLSSHGHRVTPFTKTNETIQVASLRQKTSLFRNMIDSAHTRRELASLIEKDRPDVAHFHNTFLLISPSAYQVCQSYGIPVVQTLHNFRLLCPASSFLRDGQICESCLGKQFPWPGIVHRCYRESRVQTAGVAAMLAVHHWRGTWRQQINIYIALTKFARQKFVEGGLPQERILIKPNFIMNDSGPRNPTQTGDFCVFVGRLSPEKGVQTLLTAWRDLPDIPLHIVGDGPLLPQVKRFADESAAQIRVVGRLTHDEVLAYMKRARLLVFPSLWYEGMPLVILEALACGVPVLASNIGGIQEIVVDGLNGFTFEPGNPSELVARVHAIWNQPSHLQTLGSNARYTFEAFYTPERNYALLMDIYRRAIAS